MDAVRTVRAEENHRSSWLGDGVSGGGGICQSLSLLVGFSQSASCQHALGLSLWENGGCRKINMGAWSDPVEGRVDASHEWKAGKISGLKTLAFFFHFFLFSFFMCFVLFVI